MSSRHGRARMPDGGRAHGAQRCGRSGEAPVTGISRRTLLRRSLGLGVGAVARPRSAPGRSASCGPPVGGGGAKVEVGTLDDVAARAAGPAVPRRASRPTSRRRGRSWSSSIRTSARSCRASTRTARGILNVRALSQVCPHLGCRPNPCIEDFWFHCPCHQSRYDRLGIKAAGERLRAGAARAWTGFAVEVDANGVLTIDTTQVTLGPLPVALGQPGVIPPRVPNGCM